MITVTKSYLPDISQYNEYIRQVWERGHLTNHGPLVFELEEKVRSYLGVKHCFLVNNGTIALQIALKALEVKGEVITTPFSYVATTSSIVWEGLKPVFADIESNTCCINPKEIESKISPDTKTILATHVYGLACAVEEIEDIAQKNDLNIIYDAAHAFGVKYKGTSIVNYGDISTFSFHATKIFHTI
ncbi:MAG: aminotransferase class I/II-fold pyridoxal phosphate-dependent enzyme, partial [Bacteroidota bacterium]|nr:aminotransferase class I/II-fold pyridoxal phosphate-dependent enzyme [Bacteroidota bacterium]